MQAYKYYFYSRDHEFWVLWFTHSGKLAERCLSWTGNDYTLTEDVMSGVVLRAHTKYLQFEGKIINAYAWLSKIIYNHLMEFYRNETRRKEIIEKFMEQQECIDSNHNWSEPEQEIQYIEAFESLTNLVDKLPAGLKQAYQLRVMSDMTYKEISNELNISSECARKRVQLARQKINKMVVY